MLSYTEHQKLTIDFMKLFLLVLIDIRNFAINERHTLGFEPLVWLPSETMAFRMFLFC